MNILTISLLFGGFIAIIVWQAYAIFRQVPEEDRHFMDRPALGFRLVWPLILALVFHAGQFMSDTQVQLTLARLKRAGVEYSLSPQQFLASKVVAAVFSGLLVALAGMHIGGASYIMGFLAAIGGFFYPELWLRELTQTRSTAILRTLPFYLDVITLSVEAGTNLTGGLTQAVQKTGDSPLRREFSRVLRDIRSGKTRADALRDLAERTGSPAVNNVVTGLIQAERTGSSLGPILRAQANQLRSQRFQLAEKKAMEAPVKLLAPLIMFIFPTTALVIGFILLSKAIQEGLLTWGPLVWAYTWPGQ
ncbi:type II secretion system F family protein [Granulosicoccus sp. 3-233]|uniref:type II secretion system F family protein n=1 Tax=Granulosicoccus sp. 3-233 TaxID=3417969 RepID=UPI003D343476